MLRQPCQRRNGAARMPHKSWGSVTLRGKRVHGIRRQTRGLGPFHPMVLEADQHWWRAMEPRLDLSQRKHTLVTPQIPRTSSALVLVEERDK
jgi:hypothetical protein